MNPERPPKRLRRDTRRCFECRRRKVKCQLATEAVAVCSECVKTGAICSIDPPADEGDAPSQESRGDDQRNLSSDQEARLRRIEEMLERALQAQLSPPAAFDFLNQMPSADLVFADNDNPISELASSTTAFSSTLDIKPPGSTRSHSPDFSKLYSYDPAEQALIDLLPSQKDASTLCAKTMAWIMEFPQPPGEIWRPRYPTPYADPSLATNCPSMLGIAQMLLYLALCLQQLPPDFDDSQLEKIRDHGATIKAYVQAVTSSVLADDELTCSVQGVECLYLLGTIYLNEFEVQRAWLVFRRALDVARLQGFHEGFATQSRDSTRSEGSTAYQRHLWVTAVMADCYCSLLLGVETAAGFKPFGDYQWSDAIGNGDMELRICLLTIQWLQATLLETEEGVTRAAREINQALDQLEDSVQQSWWHTPAITKECSFRAAKEYNRVLHQIWFFQLRIMINLPLLAELQPTSPDDDTAEFRETAMEAARITMHLYQTVRRVGNTQLHCRVIEMAVFIAAAAVILVSTTGSRSTRPRSDMLLAEQTINTMAELGDSCPRELIAQQSAKILGALLAASRDYSAGLSEPVLEDRISTPAVDAEDRNGARDTVNRVFRKAFSRNEAAVNVIDRGLHSLRVTRQEPQLSLAEASFLDTLLDDNAFLLGVSP